MDSKVKPEVWMPFYGQDFDRDTKGWARCDKWSYWAALWAYWCDECRGLPNDDEMLKRICECLCIARADAWAGCKQLIFGPKFRLGKDGLWHQGRAKELYSEATESLKMASDRGKSGAKARWSKRCSSNTQAMPEHILKQCGDGCLSNGSSPSPSHFKAVVGGIPTIDQCLAWLADTKKNGADYTEAETRGAFLALSAGGWQWGTRPIADWRCGLERQIQTDRQRKPHGNNSKNRPQIDRNAGTCGESAEDYGKKIAECVARRQAESAARLDALAAQVAET